MSEETFGIGLIVPSSNTVMEPDFHREFSGSAVVSTTRIFLEEVTHEAEIRMNTEELPAAIRLIKTAAPRVVIFGCTSAGSLGGIAHDAAIAQSIAAGTGARALTVIGSVLSQLKAAQPRRVAVFTPYRDEITRSVADCLLEAGFSLARVAGMGLVENREIGKVVPEEIIRFVQDQCRDLDADCVFLSCTNWRAMEAMGRLEELLGCGVFTSNQACVEEARRIVNADAAAVGQAFGPVQESGLAREGAPA
jgi:maleate isomerase